MWFNGNSRPIHCSWKQLIVPANRLVRYIRIQPARRFLVKEHENYNCKPFLCFMPAINAGVNCSLCATAVFFGCLSHASPYLLAHPKLDADLLTANLCTKYSRGRPTCATCFSFSPNEKIFRTVVLGSQLCSQFHKPSSLICNNSTLMFPVSTKWPSTSCDIDQPVIFLRTKVSLLYTLNPCKGTISIIIHWCSYSILLVLFT